MQYFRISFFISWIYLSLYLTLFIRGRQLASSWRQFSASCSCQLAWPDVVRAYTQFLCPSTWVLHSADSLSILSFHSFFFPFSFLRSDETGCSARAEYEDLYQVSALPHCDYALDHCQRDEKCSHLIFRFRQACRVREDQCVMDSRCVDVFACSPRSRPWWRALHAQLLNSNACCSIFFFPDVSERGQIWILSMWTRPYVWKVDKYPNLSLQKYKLSS